MRDRFAPQSGRKLVMAVGIGMAMAVAACSAAPSPAAPPIQAASPVPPAATAPAGDDSPSTSGQTRLVLMPQGTEARYRVREQLANVSLPSDAVGVTDDVTGTTVVSADGAIVRGESKFVVDLTTLQSDKSRRDNFIRNNTLETDRYPTAEFVPSEARGLPSPLPASGAVSFQLVGDLTLHGVTRPTTWEVTGQIVDERALVGSATTRFTFADFGMTAPRVPVVLSVEDNLRLELDFNLALETP